MTPESHALNAAVAPGASAWPTELAGPSAAARRMRDRVRELARQNRPVLVVAPRGFDAVAVASAIHTAAGIGGPFLTIDCASGEPSSISQALLGAVAAPRERADVFETVTSGSALFRALHGTLVVTSVQDLPVSAQTRLARMLRDGEVRVDGGARPVRLDLRLVATSDQPLDAEVRHGRFRSDLFKRLAARQLDVPPLRDRSEDVGAIAVALMERAASESGSGARPFTDAAVALLAALSWEGDVAELDALVRELAAAGTTEPVRVEDVLGEIGPRGLASVASPRASLREARRQFEREYIAAVLERSGWRMGQAARVLGMQRTNLYRKARQLGIVRRKGAQR
ncbi:MAG TPA: sigma 54-interacting transcriptional regulator [Vicinamibacterales bacterium]|nr:sigma 54-interacting transcriptional regulator [Vicinamibacterales bacterium]